MNGIELKENRSDTSERERETQKKHKNCIVMIEAERERALREMDKIENETIDKMKSDTQTKRWKSTIKNSIWNGRLAGKYYG